MFKADWLVKKTQYSVYLGVLCTLIAFATSSLLFSKVPNFIGVATILFAVILTIPSINKVLEFEEKIERRKKSCFFSRHRSIISFFIYFFIGVFIALFTLSLLFPGSVLDQQQYTGVQSSVSKAIHLPKGFPAPPAPSEASEIAGIFKNNIYVLIIAFILSLFYGAGALFLVVLNASIFATTLTETIRAKAVAGFFANYALLSCNLGVMLFHLIPEMGGYLIAAIGGGVLGKAIIKEKFRSEKFYAVVRDSLTLLVISIALLLIGAIVEVSVSKKIFLAGLCSTNSLWIFLIAILLIALVVFLEVKRRRHASH